MRYPIRLGARFRLLRIGPLSLSLYKTLHVFGARKRQPAQVWHAWLPPMEGYPKKWTCPHNHRREDTAEDCRVSQLRLRGVRV
jgi:hypothetical protein